jgi:hypothetical protein
MTLQPTMKLRWVYRRAYMMSSEKVLQQWWRFASNDVSYTPEQGEWRDVEVVDSLLMNPNDPNNCYDKELLHDMSAFKGNDIETEWSKIPNSESISYAQIPEEYFSTEQGIETQVEKREDGWYYKYVKL